MLKTDTVKVTVREGNTELPDGSLVIYGYDVSGRVTSEEEAVSGVTFVLFGVRVIPLFRIFFTHVSHKISQKSLLCLERCSQKLRNNAYKRRSRV